MWQPFTGCLNVEVVSIAGAVNAGAATYYMKSIYDYTLRNDKHLLKARELLWKHIEFSLYGLLQSFKQAIGLFSEALTELWTKNTKNAGSSRSTTDAIIELLRMRA
jgi:hypothetical protein